MICCILYIIPMSKPYEWVWINHKKKKLIINLKKAGHCKLYTEFKFVFKILVASLD